MSSKKCLFCEKDTKNPKFCGSSCAAKYNNKHREYKPLLDKRKKIVSCMECKKQIKRNIRASSYNILCNKCKEKRKVKWICINHKKHKNRQTKRKELKIKYLGDRCYFCGNNEYVLDTHKKDGKKHKGFFEMRDKEFIFAVKSGEFVRVCKRCHRSVHWVMRFLKLNWEDIDKHYHK